MNAYFAEHMTVKVCYKKQLWKYWEIYCNDAIFY